MKESEWGMVICWVVLEGLSEGLTFNLVSYQPHFSLHISQNGLKMEKREGTCGNIKKEEAEIQYLSETFQSFI